ncbi:HAD-IIB family hydrolase [Paraglaciecola sp.]|nr:HAD-IIB family hydrolase [Paraglaciecola sp.]MDB4281806.1 HAD-IIB family hydrolase [Paraglaciecola sp.]
MTLVVFDLDGTLLNAQSEVSSYTAETLRRLTSQGVSYTVATGRTLQAASAPIAAHGFVLPQIIKNGAVIWDPTQSVYSHRHLLTPPEVWHVLAAFTMSDIAPFVFTLEDDGTRHAVYHPPLRYKAEQKMALMFSEERKLPLQHISKMPDDAHVINVSAMGPRPAIQAVIDSMENEPHLVAYTGTAIEAKALCWLDIHHSQGSKGNAVTTLKEELGFNNIVVFGDGDNDLSMFACADEAYAPANADDAVKAIASEVIGHHDEDGVARFLRQRFKLGD